jgi:ribosomal protein S18 acetylase RimI-like enzyme
MIEYSSSLENITPSQLEGFFEDWWAKPNSKTFLQTLHGSSHVVLALENEQVVGFISAISDGVMFVYISLLEVLPTHQHQGIASELMRQMLLHYTDLYAIDTSCDDQLIPFYEHFGMARGNAMIKRNYTPKYLKGN